MKKILITFLLLLSAFSSAHAFQTIVLQNATDCKVTIKSDLTQTTSKVTAIDIYSFYYASQDPQTRTYYNTIPAGQSGNVAVGDYSPGVSPPRQGINLGFAPSPGYTTGSLSYYRSQQPNNYYIYQFIDQTDSYCTYGPCIAIDSKNPCESQNQS